MNICKFKMITKYDRWGVAPFLVGECQLSFAIYTIDTGLLTGGKMKDSTNVYFEWAGTNIFLSRKDH